MTKPDAATAANDPQKPAASVTLETPIRRGDTVITRIDLRKPKTGELRGLLVTDLLQMKVDALAALLPRISSPTLTRPEIDALDPADLIALGGEAIGFFLSRGQREQTLEATVSESQSA